jgi:hypothetical protein
VRPRQYQPLANWPELSELPEDEQSEQCHCCSGLTIPVMHTTPLLLQGSKGGFRESMKKLAGKCIMEIKQTLVNALVNDETKPNQTKPNRIAKQGIDETITILMLKDAKHIYMKQNLKSQLYTG